MRRISLAPFLLLFPSFSAAQEDWKGPLAAAIARATTQNPEIGAMEARIAAAHHRAGQATALPDPEIELALVDVPLSDFSLSRDPMTMEQIGARQKLPPRGRRPALESAAEADVASETAAHREHVVRLAAEAADAFFELGEIDARVAILEESRRRLGEAAASATERYRVGKGAQADVLRANLEVTATEERLVALRGERRSVAARFQALQALPASGKPAATPLPETDPSSPSTEALLADAAAQSPVIAAETARLHRAEEERRLASIERRPEISLSAFYGHRVSYDDMGGAAVGLTLPFFQPKRLHEREAEADAQVSEARANVETARNRIQQEVVAAQADLDRALEQARLYRGSILPQAETNARAAEQAYVVGQVDFLTFVRAELDRDAYAGELVTRRAAAWRALAALQKASGLPLVPGTPAEEMHHD